MWKAGGRPMSAGSLNASERAQAAALRAALGLPRAVQRRLAPPARIDGLELDPEVSMALRLGSTRQELEDLGVQRARPDIRERARIAGGAPIPMAAVEERSVDGAQGPLGARLYVPPAADGEECCPLLVYFHGGGWVVGDLDSHDAPCRLLAAAAGVRVLSVDYRLAPEHPWPAAVEDALAAFASAQARAKELGADPARIAVGGDSAGGHLSAIVAQQAIAAGGPAPAFQLLIYPVTDRVEKSRSYELFPEGFFLTEATMDWYWDNFLSGPAADADPADPRISPLRARDLAGLPPAYVAAAGFDVLRDEGEAYAARLREAGVRVALNRHDGLIHGFANALGAGRSCREAMLAAAGALRLGLAPAS